MGVGGVVLKLIPAFVPKYQMLASFWLLVMMGKNNTTEVKSKSLINVIRVKTYIQV